MNYEFPSPDKVMVGTRGVVGNRLFLLQARQGRRLVVVKCEKQQLSALAEWIAVAIKEMGRPGHLPADFALEDEIEQDLVAGDISVLVDEESKTIELTIESLDEEDTLVLGLTREMAGGLAIAITRLVEAGRAPCPLCGGPLDPRGHDCPRTNGFAPPIS